MNPFHRSSLVFAFVVACIASSVRSDEAPFIDVWPDLAPLEASRETGITLPFRAQDVPRITRVEKVRRPRLEVFRSEAPNGTAVLIMPGGGFGRIVPDLEGSEAAPFLNQLGITVFVLHYRTNEAKSADEPSWKRPLQDGQRSLRLIRSRSKEWKLDHQRLGVLGFSAGGQVASILHTRSEDDDYEPIDEVDDLSSRPDFSMLVYPWRIQDPKTGELLQEIQVGKNSPPAFIVHTHDDNSSSMGAVLMYAGLKKYNVSAELHVYENGGHGYGTRDRPNSNIGSWPDRATDWLVQQKLGRK